MIGAFIDTPYSKEPCPFYEEVEEVDEDFDPDTYDADTYEKYLYYCRRTGGDPYTKEEWERIVYGKNNQRTV